MHPLLNRIAGKGESSLETPIEEKEAVEERIEESLEEEIPITPPTPPTAKAEGGEEKEVVSPPIPIPTPTPTVAATTAPATPAPMAAESRTGEAGAQGAFPVGPVEVQVPKEFVERIDQLEEEIGKLRKELSTINESLKGIILEVKEVLAEASSPFNVLRTPLEEVREKEKEFNGGRKKKIQGNGGSRVLASKVKLPPSKFIYLTKLASDMLRKMRKEQAIELVKGYAEAGVFDKETGETLVKIIELVDKMRSHGLTVEEQLPYLYTLAKTLGIEDPELEKIMLKELLVKNK